MELGVGQPLDGHLGGMSSPQAESVLKFASSTISANAVHRLQSAAPLVDRYWFALKEYFEVDNRYVLSKIRTILTSLFLRNKRWTRECFSEHDEASAGSSRKFKPPTLDPNAPDLYLPLMSFVTYILVCSYIKGTNGKFTPEVLTQVMYSCLGFQLLEVLAIRCGLYALQAAPSPILDLVSNTGYKYIGLCANMVVGMLLGSTTYYLALLWTGTMTTFFMLKVLTNNHAKVAHDSPTMSARMPALWGFALLQFLSIWWLGYGRDIAGNTSANSEGEP